MYGKEMSRSRVSDHEASGSTAPQYSATKCQGLNECQVNPQSVILLHLYRHDRHSHSYHVSPLLDEMLRIGQNMSDITGWTWTELWLPLMWVIHTYMYIIYN